MNIRIAAIVGITTALVAGPVVSASAATAAQLHATPTSKVVVNKKYHFASFGVKFSNTGGTSGRIGDFKAGSSSIMMEPVVIGAHKTLKGPFGAPCGKAAYTLQFYPVSAYGHKLVHAKPVGSVRIPAC